jgi:ABC-type xylose transport system permease subunit
LSLAPERQLEVSMRIWWVVLAVWLAIGALAGAQRHYYSSYSESCSGMGTTVVTILAGPLNYMGGNPKLTCH